MAEGSIDNLSIRVSANANAAVGSLNRLVTSIERLEANTSGGVSSLSRYSSALRSVKAAVQGIDLSALNSTKLNATLPKNLERLSTALATMPVDAASRLGVVAASLRGFSDIKLGAGAVNQLARIPAVVQQFKGLDMGSFSTQMGRLNAQISTLATNVARLAAAYKQLPKSMQTAGLAARSVAANVKHLSEANKEASASSKELNFSISSMTTKFAALTAAWYTAKRTIGGCINDVNTYIENMNLFEASMGRFTQKATEFGQSVQDAMGIDFGQWARNQGVFQTLITGMGGASDKAAIMSQQLTQLGYDISSFYNISVEDAMLKLQSGMAGELEPLRRLGWDLSNARMQLEATNMGIETSVQEMTQAEKVMLRYHMIMTQVTQVHGDMARTIESPANQLRVLQAQLTLAARAIGNLFIPALNAILPVVIAVVKAIRFLAEEIANFFGIDAHFEIDYSGVDYSGMLDGADAAEETAGAIDDATEAAEKYKNSVMGFDELNKLNAPTQSGAGKANGADGAGSGAGFNIPLETYDFMKDLQSELAKRSDELAHKILNVGRVLGDVLKLLPGAAMLLKDFKLEEILANLPKLAKALKLDSAIVNVGRLAKEFAPFSKISAGAARFSETIGKIAPKIAEIAAPVAKLLSPVLKIAGALGTIWSIVDLFISGKSIFDSITTGANISADAVFGLCTSFLGIGLALAPATGGISLIVAAVLSAVTIIGSAIYNNWDWLCENIFEPLASWFETNVIQPVQEAWGNLTGFFAGLWQDIVDNTREIWQPIETWFSDLWGSISGCAEAVFHDIGVFADGCWQVVTRVWDVASAWFDKTVIQPIKRVFDDAWQNLQRGAEIAWNGIKTVFSGLASHFRGIFSDAWSGIMSIFQAGGYIFNGITENIVNAFRWMLNNLIGGLNWALAQPFYGLNAIIGAMRGWEIFGIYPFAGFWDVPVPQIPYLAEGRYGIEAGQLFVARERGAEMVGTMGSHTTVANNQQIVEGIEQGVMSAMLQVLPAFQPNDTGGDVTLVLRVGNETLAQAVNKGNASLARRGRVNPELVFA